MATLLRIDSKIINLDLVFEIEDYGDRMRIFYAVPSSDTAGVQQPSYTDIDGFAADRLRDWLDAHAADILMVPEDEQFGPIDDVGGARQVGAEDDAARLAALRSGTLPRGEETGEAAYYGTARIQQMHGAGSTPPEPSAES